MAIMTRNEAARAVYRENRYMSHLTNAELEKRLCDCVNIGVGLKDGKVSLSNPMEGVPEDHPIFGFVWQKRSDTLEEYSLRGNIEIDIIDSPGIGPQLNKVQKIGPPTKDELMVDWKTEDETGLGQRISDVAEASLKKYPRSRVLVKYGERHHMEQLVQNGTVRIGTARGFEKDLNLARQDYETSFEIYPAGGKRVVRCADYWLWCCTVANEGLLWVARCVHDFGADAAVVIVGGDDFIFEMQDMMGYRTNARFRASGINYSDPLLDNDVQPADVPFMKHFRYMYQREQRCVWMPIYPLQLEPVFLNVKAGIQRYLVV